MVFFFFSFSSFSIFCAVPRCETLSRLQDNESFPLLGKQGRTLTRAGWLLLLLLPGPRPGFFFPVPFTRHFSRRCRGAVPRQVQRLRQPQRIWPGLAVFALQQEAGEAGVACSRVQSGARPGVSREFCPHPCVFFFLSERPTTFAHRVSFCSELGMPQIVVCIKVFRLTFIRFKK